MNFVKKVLSIINKSETPLAIKELHIMLGNTERFQRKKLQKVLDQLIDEGLIFKKGSKVVSVSDENFYRGRVSTHPRGFAFVESMKCEADIFLPPREARRVLDGDEVIVEVIKERGESKTSGRILKVISFGKKNLVGKYFKEGARHFIYPHFSGQKRPIPLIIKTANLKSGDNIVASIVRDKVGKVTNLARYRETMLEDQNADFYYDLMVKKYDLPVTWPKKVIIESNMIAETCREIEIGNRVDLTELSFVTIDGETAKDFDDAVYAETTDGGYTLFVAIADVSSFVDNDSALNQEAQLRGNSVYFARKVIPMLPEVLSNDLCSLKPNLLRQVVVAKLKISFSGDLMNFEFFEAVIESKARLTYEQAEDIIKSNSRGKNEKENITSVLKNLFKVYSSLRCFREGRSALKLDSAEIRCIFNAESKLYKIQQTERLDSQRVIEECMVIANVAAARLLKANEGSSIYRSHPPPDSDKIEDLKIAAKSYGISLQNEDLSPLNVCNLILAKTVKRADRVLIEGLVMRSQKLAVYDAKNSQHFGLALDEYTHFTSPIRRYTDLLVHRRIKEILNKQENNCLTEIDAVKLAKHCSETERLAEQATREELFFLKVEYLKSRASEPLQAIVKTVMEDIVILHLSTYFLEGVLPSSGINRKKVNGSKLSEGSIVEVYYEHIDVVSKCIYFTQFFNHTQVAKSFEE